MKLIVNGTTVDTTQLKQIGSGGEADIFDIGSDQVLKVLKDSSHPTAQLLPPDQRKALDDKLTLYQSKLVQFPSGLPHNVIYPRHVARRPNGTIYGYTMPFIRDAELLKQFAIKPFRQKYCSNAELLYIFKAIRGTLMSLHGSDVVIGDFNDMNIMVKGHAPFFIDTDSYQFGPFLGVAYMEKFIDPLLCAFDPLSNAIVLQSPMGKASDWYAYNVLLMQCLLLLAGGPYGGVYTPKDKTKNVPRMARPSLRITVFDKDVVFPVSATHFSALNDEILHYWHEIFKKDRREEFPEKLLDMKWVKCPQCEKEHCRPACPVCKHMVVAPEATKKMVVIHGKAKQTVVFRALGNSDIVYATVQDNKPRWVLREGDSFKRETGTQLFSGKLSTGMRFRIRGDNTLVSSGNRVMELDGSGNSAGMVVAGTYQDKFAVFDANSNHKFWIQGDQIVRSGKFAPENIAQVIPGQAMFWTGEKFGTGFYRVGNMLIGFIFKVDSSGIIDSLRMPIIQGQLISADAVIGEKSVWQLFTFTRKGKTINCCSQYSPTGELLGYFEAEEGEDNWLGGIYGKCCINNRLFSPTSKGVAMIEPSNGGLVETLLFQDTANFVDETSYLMASAQGIYVADNKEIFLLQIA